MNIAVLYREPLKKDPGYSEEDYPGRGGLKHIRKIRDVLQSCGHGAALVDINLDSYEHLRKGNFNLAFNLCDDGFYNNSLLEAHVPAMLDVLQIPYTGSDFFSLATCLNKARTKEILSFYDILTPLFQVFYSSEEKLNKDLHFPLIVKPLHEDASIAVRKKSVVSNLQELRKRVHLVLKEYCQPALVEKFIAGREIYVGILGSKENLTVLPLSEIIFNSKLLPMAQICTYEAKWVPESRYYQSTPVECPAKLAPALEQRIIAIAKKAYNLLGCQDYGRIDFRLDKNNQPYLLEVNPNPDISENAGLAKMAKAAGMSYEGLIEKILTLALERSRCLR